MGVASRKLAETKFARQRMISQLEDVYGVAPGRAMGAANLPTLPVAIPEGRR